MVALQRGCQICIISLFSLPLLQCLTRLHMLDGTTARPFFPRRANGAIIAQVDGSEEERDLDGMAINVDLEYQVGEGGDCLCPQVG